MAMGFPVGIAYLIQHPIAGAEGAVKATWNDWSPLFHGNVRLWLHNTYQHPLAPILDVAGVLSGGGALAGRAAAGVGKVGEAAAAAEGAAKVDSVVASVGRLRFGGHATADTAFTAGAKIGAASTAKEVAAHSPYFIKLLQFANPAKYALATYTKMAETLGYTGESVTTFARAALQNDPAARRLLVGADSGGMTGFKELSTNPWTRVRQAQLAKLGDVAVAKAPILRHVMGTQRAFEKWAHLSTGGRRTAMHEQIHGELVAAGAIGKANENLTAAEIVAMVKPTMDHGIMSQAHILTPAGPAGSAEFAKQIEELTTRTDKTGPAFQGLRDPNHPSYQKAHEAALATVDKLDATGKAADKQAALEGYFNHGWAHASVTTKADEMLRDANGNLRIVSKGDHARSSSEFLNSSKVVKMLYTEPTKVWRWFILGASPRYFVNNYVGNSIMMLAATDPVTFVKAFRSYMNILHNPEVAASGEAQILLDLRGNNWIKKHYAGEMGFGRSSGLNPISGLVEDGTSPVTKLLGGKANVLMEFTHRHADLPQRYLALISAMHKMPEYQQAYAKFRAGGMGHFAAERKAADYASQSEAVRQLVRQHVNHVFGQYHTFTRFEQGIRKLVPFYSWDRAIVVHMKHLIVTQPYKVAMGAALGTVGNYKTQEIMGNVPDFLQSAIPAKLLSGPLGILQGLIGQNKSQRMGMINAMSISPYGTIGDLSHMAMSLTGTGKGNFRTGESLGATLNPFIQGAAQQLAGVDLSTGAPVAPASGGPIVGIYKDTFGNIPQYKLVEALLGHEGSSVGKTGNPKLYEKNVQANLSSWLGLPIRQVSLPAAKALYDKQQMIIKPPKPRKLNYPGL
jgi:hypothetical protein